MSSTPLYKISSSAMGSSDFSEVLTPEALSFVARLHQRFNSTREDLLSRRIQVQRKIDGGWYPEFLTETRAIREANWKGAPIPQDIQDRRVEITGPPERKMLINALNSGAKAFMADLEDSHSPTWPATLEGQINLRQAVRRKITYQSPEGKNYQLNSNTAVLFVRPRGWHLLEKHFYVDGKESSASLFDFGLFFFHNAKEQINRGTGPYFYLPKLESHLEARLWNEVFNFAQDELGIPRGTIRATVLIETILAAFEMDEIIYELREHSAGLNCGRWDYIFSFIKKFSKNPSFVLPDRTSVTMNTHFLKSYVALLVKTCHRRGVHAMGGMAAEIPIKNDESANLAALEKVRNDKLREVSAGHDGTWVAHPGLVKTAQSVFDREMQAANQIEKVREESPSVLASDLLRVPEGEITAAGFRKNINVALLYLESWLSGVGCVPLYNVMEDAATVEIARAQIWQWIKHPRGKFKDGTKITRQMFQRVLEEEKQAVFSARKQSGLEIKQDRLGPAARILDQIISNDDFIEFLTLPAYDELE